MSVTEIYAPGMPPEACDGTDMLSTSVTNRVCIAAGKAAKSASQYWTHCDFKASKFPSPLVRRSAGGSAELLGAGSADGLPALGFDGPSAFKAQRRFFVFKILRSSLIAIWSTAGAGTVPALPSAVSPACGSDCRGGDSSFTAPRKVKSATALPIWSSIPLRFFANLM